MLVIRQKMIYREDIRNNPSLLYVFGDNLDRLGMGGQAYEMRGEPNSFGIATKRSISHSYPDDYFHEHQNDVLKILYDEFERLEKSILEGDYEGIVIPLDGLGTGLSRLPELCPSAARYIEQRIKDLEYL